MLRLLLYSLLLDLARALILRVRTSLRVSSAFDKPLEAYVIASKSSTDVTSWQKSFQNAFDSVELSPPVHLEEPDVQSLLSNGTVHPNYKSWYVPKYDAHNVMKNPKFPHELGCTLAHRNVWHHFLDSFSRGKTAPWAAVFESDALLRHDFSQRVKQLQSQLHSTTADIILLGHCFEECPSYPSSSIDLGEGVHAVHSNHPVCTHAYLVSAAGAKKLLGLTVPMKQAVDERIRTVSGDGRIHSLSVCPPISRQPWQQETEMYTSFADGAASFARRGGNVSDFIAFDHYVKSLHE